MIEVRPFVLFILKWGLLVSAGLLPWLALCWLTGLLLGAAAASIFLAIVWAVIVIGLLLGGFAVWREQAIFQFDFPYMRKSFAFALAMLAGGLCGLAAVGGAVWAFAASFSIGFSLFTGLGFGLVIPVLAIVFLGFVAATGGAYLRLLRWCGLPFGSAAAQSTTLVGPAD